MTLLLFQAQVHLLGNIAIWYTCSSGVLGYSGLLVFYLLRRRRQCYDISEGMNPIYCVKINNKMAFFTDAWNRFVNFGEVLLGGYLFHYIPFYFYDRTLFVHHYLPAYMFKIMLTSALFAHVLEIMTCKYIKLVLYSLVFLWMSCVLKIFSQFSTLSFGENPLSADQVKDLKWKDTWDLIIHKP